VEAEELTSVAPSEKLFSFPAAVPCGCRLGCQRRRFGRVGWSASHPARSGISQPCPQPAVGGCVCCETAVQGTGFPGARNISDCVAGSFCWLRVWSCNELVICSRSASFCAEHARRNALALQAQMKKSNPGPASETLLCQLSSYARTELGSQTAESSRSEASRILGEN